MRYLAPMPPPVVSTPDSFSTSPFRFIYQVCGGVHATTQVLRRNSGRAAIIVDVIVLPEFQGNGIGKTMMQEAMDYIKSNINEGQFIFVNLMAAKGKESFYSQFGFEVRPNEKVGAGMTQYIYHAAL